MDEKLERDLVDEVVARNLVCAMLQQAVYDSVCSLVPAERVEAHLWISSPASKHLADLIGVGDVWPPSVDTLIGYRASLISRYENSNSKRLRLRARVWSALARKEKRGAVVL